VDLLDLATLLHLYVINNLPFAFDAFGMLPLVVIHDATHCDAAV